MSFIDNLYLAEVSIEPLKIFVCVTVLLTE